jgi:glutamate-1-semialdehyde 2,1-aminomutase
MASTATSTSITDRYEQEFSRSRQIFERSKKSIVGGITHDGRYIKPFPPFIERADGAYKWDVDGHKLIDYCVGHGSLILGHNDPEISEAMREQALRGTHHSAGHEGEVRWAEKVVELVPSAELVRFTASGTESTLLAMRVARGFTERSTILKFDGHFHGWQDYALKGEKPPFEATSVPGIPDATLGSVAVLPSNDIGMLEERLVQGDVAAVILEPSGASWATIPFKDDFLRNVREITRKHAVLLIFDEVITGFRWSPGGAQGRFGIVPDLTTMAKIIAGGMPGGAVAGRRDVMEMIEFKDEPGWNSGRRIPHAGTYNANPVAAAAGYTALTKCADPSVQTYCDDLAANVRTGLNQVISTLDVPGFVWGESSVFHVALGEQASNFAAGDMHTPEGVTPEFLKSSGGTTLGMAFEIGMLLEGVHVFHSGGLLSTRHTDADVEHTVNAAHNVFSALKSQGAFG